MTSSHKEDENLLYNLGGYKYFCKNLNVQALALAYFGLQKHYFEIRILKNN